jgi:small GTP-binding protein
VWDDETNISLQLWDVAGHERFGTMTRVYYRYAIAAVIVFDVTRPATFEAVTKWKDDVNSKVVLPNGEQIPILLLANKCDLADGGVDGEKLDAFVKQHGMIGWFATSAQDNINVDQAMKYLIGKVLDVSKKVQIERPAQPAGKNSNLKVVDSNYEGVPSSAGAGKKTQNKEGCCN